MFYEVIGGGVVLIGLGDLRVAGLCCVVHLIKCGGGLLSVFFSAR